MVPQERPGPSPADARRRSARRIAAFYVFAGAAIIGILAFAFFGPIADAAIREVFALAVGGLIATAGVMYLYSLRVRSPDFTPGAPIEAARRHADPGAGVGRVLAIFGAVSAAVTVLLLVSLVRDIREHRDFVHTQLTTTVNLKANLLEVWLEGRRLMAQSLSGAIVLRQELMRRTRGAPPGLSPVAERRLSQMKEVVGSDALCLLDAEGELVAAIGDPVTLSPGLRDRVRKTIAGGQALIHFLHREPDGGLYLEYVLPMNAVPDDGSHVGAILLRLDARRRLVPLLQEWSTTSLSAETTLVRREGDQVVHLMGSRSMSPPSGQSDSHSAQETRLLDVQAVTGDPGALFSGNDHRGIQVLGAAQRVVGTDWLMIVKVDADEALASARREAWYWSAVLLSTLLLAGFGVASLWRQQMRLVAARERADTIERQALKGHLDLLSRYANDIILLIDVDGRVVEANDRAIEKYGYPRETLIGLHAVRLRSPKEPSSLDGRFATIWKAGSSVHESLHATRSGNEFPVEISGRRVDTAGGAFIQAIIRDISERKLAEARIARLTQLREALSEINRAIVHATDEDALFAEICAIAVRHSDFVLAWVGIPDKDSGAIHPLTSAGPPAGLEYVGRLKLSWRDVPEGRGPAGTAIREARTVVANDFLGDTRYAPWHEAAREAGIRASAAVPLRHGGEVVAVLLVCSATANYFDAEIVSLLEEMAGDVSFSLDVLAGNREREKAQRELEFKNTVLSTQRQTSPDAILVVDEGGRIISYNQKFLELWNIPEEMVRTGADEPVLQAVVAQMWNPDEFINKIKHLYETRAEKSHDELQTKDGRTIDRHSAPMTGYGGEYYGRVWYFRDITERRRNELALAESETRFRRMAETIGEVFWMTPPDGSSIVYVSPAFEKIWGWSCEALYAAPELWMKAIHPEDTPNVLASLKRVADGGTYDIEFRITHRDGSLRWISDRGYAIRDDTGRVILITGVATDITERKRSELDLRESEQRFRAMIEQSISGFYMIQDDRFTYVNSRFTEIFGYASPDEIVGKRPSELIAPKDRATVAANIQRRLEGKVKSVSYSFAGQRKDGSEIEIGVHGSLAVYQGKPVIMGLLQDISERKRAEEEIKRYVARLEQAMQSTINVVATIGELRDPYTHGHERRVGEIAAAIATEMGLENNQVEGIRIAGYLHDVGKIAVPAEILAKPAKLTRAEFDLVKDHAQQSYEILKTVPFPWPVAEAAWQHHERLDGSGYPRGLKGEEIIREARILAVADTVEAMSSHRPYRPGLGLDKALAEIEKNRGRLYDPGVVDACLRLFREKGYLIPA